MARQTAPSEKKFHDTMHHRDTRDGAIKGGLTGAGVGALLKHLGHTRHSGAGTGAVVGAMLGAGSGHLKGQERVLRDTVGQERQHQRAEARVKKSYDQIAMEAFAEKVAFAGAVLPAVTRLGQGLLTGGSRLARATGTQQGFGKGLQQAGKFFGGGAVGRQRLGTAVGVGTLGLGAAGAAGAAASRR